MGMGKCQVLQLGTHGRMAIDPALAHCLLMRLGRRSLRRAVASDSAWGHPGMRLSRVSPWTGQFARAQARVSGATPDAQGRPHNDHLAQDVCRMGDGRGKHRPPKVHRVSGGVPRGLNMGRERRQLGAFAHLPPAARQLDGRVYGFTLRRIAC